MQGEYTWEVDPQVSWILGLDFMDLDLVNMGGMIGL